MKVRIIKNVDQFIVNNRTLKGCFIFFTVLIEKTLRKLNTIVFVWHSKQHNKVSLNFNIYPITFFCFSMNVASRRLPWIPNCGRYPWADIFLRQYETKRTGDNSALPYNDLFNNFYFYLRRFIPRKCGQWRKSRKQTKKIKKVF